MAVNPRMIGPLTHRFAVPPLPWGRGRESNFSLPFTAGLKRTQASGLGWDKQPLRGGGGKSIGRLQAGTGMPCSGLEARRYDTRAHDEAGRSSWISLVDSPSVSASRVWT